ncbi:MAG: hypothetical protein K2M94_02655 [Paramuribaculum sp.]|nr:hypothetical protein [Paramuribaculum sp.]
MKIKSFITAALCAMAFIGTSCTDSDPRWEPSPETESPEYYFNAATNTSFNVGENDTEFTVTVWRSNDDVAATLPLKAECEYLDLFEVPATVDFEKGSKTADFTVTYDATKLPPMETVSISFSVGDGKGTEWAPQTATYAITYFPWVDVVGPNGEEYGTWVDDILTTFFRFTPDPNPRLDVKIQSSPAVKGLYRVIDPYAGFAEYDFGYDTSTPHYLYINCANPAEVFFCDQTGKAANGTTPYYFFSGSDAGYGQIVFTGLYNTNMADGDTDTAIKYAGKFENNVIKFPTKSLLIAMLNYQNAGFYYANTNGAFRILWPGAKEEEPEEPEPDEGWTSLGTGEYTDAFVYPMYGVEEPVTWSVEVQQNNETPSLYRMVNPYKAGVMPDGNGYEGNKYVELDAANPNCVNIPMVDTGFDDAADGPTYIFNYAYYLTATGKTESEIIASGFNDTFTNNVFTIKPGDACIAWFDSEDEEISGGFWRTNSEGSLVLGGDASRAAAANTQRINLSKKCNLIELKKVSPLNKYVKPNEFNSIAKPLKTITKSH